MQKLCVTVTATVAAGPDRAGCGVRARERRHCGTIDAGTEEENRETEPVFSLSDFYLSLQAKRQD